MNVFVAGASGVIGRSLVRLLCAAGHAVTGTTRSAAKAGEIEALGARAVVLDVYDAAALRQAMLAAKPEVVINQLTDLPMSATRRRSQPRALATPASAARARAT